jgi:hypothetical protein
MKPVQHSAALYRIVHQLFPESPRTKTDPLFKIEEPMQTVGYTLRYLLA